MDKHLPPGGRRQPAGSVEQANAADDVEVQEDVVRQPAVVTGSVEQAAAAHEYLFRFEGVDVIMVMINSLYILQDL